MAQNELMTSMNIHKIALSTVTIIKRQIIIYSSMGGISFSLPLWLMDGIRA